MNVISKHRFRFMTLIVALSVSASFAPACQRREREKENETEPLPDMAALRQSLEALKPVLAAQDVRFAGLRKQLEALPSDLPSLPEVRAKFYAVDEGRGIMGAKLGWLSARLDSAVQAKRGDELAKLGKEIKKTHDELAEIDRIALALLHQLAQLERMAKSQSAELGSAETFTRVLPTQYEVKAEPNGMEQRLLEFLDETGKALDQNTWFDFDRVVFAATGAELEHERSDAQLRNVSEILKAYPKLKLKLAAFSDNSGSAAANKTLTTQRAQSAKKELVRLGIAASRLEAQGYGAEQAICPANDSDECRSKNGRLAARVIAK